MLRRVLRLLRDLRAFRPLPDLRALLRLGALRAARFGALRERFAALRAALRGVFVEVRRDFRGDFVFEPAFRARFDARVAFFCAAIWAAERFFFAMGEVFLREGLPSLLTCPLLSDALADSFARRFVFVKRRRAEAS